MEYDDDDDVHGDDESFNLCKRAADEGCWEIVKLAWDHGCSCSDSIKLQCSHHQLEYQLQAIQQQLERSHEQQKQQQQQQQQLSDIQHHLLSIVQLLSFNNQS